MHRQNPRRYMCDPIQMRIAAQVVEREDRDVFKGTRRGARATARGKKDEDRTGRDALQRVRCSFARICLNSSFS